VTNLITFSTTFLLNLVQLEIAPFDKRSAGPWKPQPKTKHKSGSDAPYATYSPLNYIVALKLGFWVTQGHRKWHYSIEDMRFLFVFHNKYASIYYCFRDIAAYRYSLCVRCSGVNSLGVKPSELRNLSFGSRAFRTAALTVWNSLRSCPLMYYSYNMP